MSPTTTPEIRHALWRWHPESRQAAGAWRLQRRGYDHGILERTQTNTIIADPVTHWAQSRPLLLRGWLAESLRLHRPATRRSAAFFERMRAGGDFEAELWRRVGEDGVLRPAGSSIDERDEREIEKVHADIVVDDRTEIEDLYAKLSWVSATTDDESMRIRFSFGSELLDDWQSDPRRSVAADDFASAAFPECETLAADPRIRALLRRLTGRSVRMSERIIFSNAPRGGARFHHDAEEGQLGVAYGQLRGRTAWLALPKRELAAILCQEFARGSNLRTPGKWLKELGGDNEDITKLLNRDRKLTRRLVEAGHLYVLEAGDALLLPSHGVDDCAWHSVFALGQRPSIALSFGLFPAIASVDG